ncbi:hypothetical protein AKO1_005186 [Acrasis kona]|uniref:Uncharacterized protein n=1 Tax=Acrasis kona TaxID=1008807 RepID=A0AAW2Z5Q6_9EUKA
MCLSVLFDSNNHIPSTLFNNESDVGNFTLTTIEKFLFEMADDNVIYDPVFDLLAVLAGCENYTPGCIDIIIKLLSSMLVPPQIHIGCIKTLSIIVEASRSARSMVLNEHDSINQLKNHINDHLHEVGDVDNFMVKLKEHDLDKDFMQSWHHCICTCLVENFNNSCGWHDFIIRQCIWACLNGTKYHCKEALQYLYICSRSNNKDYQSILCANSASLIESFVYCLHNRDDVVAYMVINEACDHLIVTDSVRDFVAVLLSHDKNQVSVLAKNTIPLLKESRLPQLRKAVLKLFSTMSTAISSTTGAQMNFFADYLGSQIILPFIENKNMIETIGEEDRAYIIQVLISENRIIPMLADADASKINPYLKDKKDMLMLADVRVENNTSLSLIKELISNPLQGLQDQNKILSVVLPINTKMIKDRVMLMLKSKL